MTCCSKWMRFTGMLALWAMAVWATAQPCAPGERTYLGEVRVLGNGTVGTWVTVDASGTPRAIGASISEGALSGLPHEMVEYTLAFPPQAAAVPFTHFTLDWQPHGHIPEGVYNVPHFDLHFYLITPEARERITATGEDLARVERTPEAQFIPQGYVATPGGEPRMGAHWIDPASPEFHGQPFTETFIYGFYDGRMVFLEPMMTTAYLATRPSVFRVLPLPVAYPTRGYYPTTYSVRYDQTSRLYIIALGGLTLR